MSDENPVATSDERRPRCSCVLVVEDDTDIRETLLELLVTAGYAAYACTNGKEALEMLKTMPGNCLILLDLMMPVMTGWEFLETQRTDAVLAALPVVVVSAVKPDMVAPKPGDPVLPPNPPRYLKKPIALQAFWALVEEFCGPAPAPF